MDTGEVTATGNGNVCTLCRRSHYREQVVGGRGKGGGGFRGIGAGIAGAGQVGCWMRWVGEFVLEWNVFITHTHTHTHTHKCAPTVLQEHGVRPVEID